MALTFAEEKTSAIWDEALPLMMAHWQEVGRDRDLLILDPDVERIMRMEHDGLWKAFTVRADGKLVGYSAYCISPHIHYRSNRCAVNDVIFLAPAHRGAGVAGRFIRTIDAALKVYGCDKVFMHVKLSHDFGRLLESIGYVWEEKIFARRLR